MGKPRELQGWIKGYGAIAAYMGSKAKNKSSQGNYVRSLERKGAPIRRMPGNIPTIIPYEADAWLRAYSLVLANKAVNKKTKKLYGVAARSVAGELTGAAARAKAGEQIGCAASSAEYQRRRVDKFNKMARQLFY